LILPFDLRIAAAALERDFKTLARGRRAPAAPVRQ